MNDTQAPLQGAEWQDTQIYVPFFDRSYPGRELVGSGLGYVIASQSKETTFFVPTHVLSGYAASAESFHSEEMCQKYLQELAPLMNWNQPLDALVKDPAYQPKKFQELAKKFWIDDAADTAGGDAW